MTVTVYPINRGSNAHLEFRGLKAQYIWYLGGGLVLILLLFTLLYTLGVHPYVCLGIVLVLGTLLFIVVYRLNNRYGAYGLMRLAAAKKIPAVIRITSRKLFIKTEHHGKEAWGAHASYG